MNTAPTELLRSMFDAAIQAAQPSHSLPPQLPAPPRGRTIVIGAGKASAAMARSLEDNWPGELSGLVVTRYGYQVPCQRIEIIEAAHPVPDAAGQVAAARILQMVQGLSADDLVIALISGGGSSLLAMPGDGISLEDKQTISRDLLKSGASISEINCVRRHLSAIKGGRLGVACHPARLLTLLISDVPGDNPADIASGPTVADSTTCSDALEVLQRYHISVPPGATRLLDEQFGETIKPDDSRIQHSEVRMVATPQMALEAAADVAHRHGIRTLLLGDSIEGEAREVAQVLAGITLSAARHGHPLAPPCVLISGGETTVTVRGNGRGGRNVEFLLALGVSLRGQANVYAIAGDTDGVDGAEEVAGALLTPDTLQRALALGINARASLANNDGHGFFEALGDQIITGPTLTNVNDFRAIYIGS